MKNEERFTEKADIYRKYRSSYPKKLIDYLYSEIGFRENSVIADIGSGTGIFSRLLLERGSRVYGVEPNDAMRRIAEKDFGGAAGFETYCSVKASAENTGLAENSVDFVTVAQAFHWFAMEAFRTECQRILKDGGKAVLVWNARDFESEFMKKEYDIRKMYSIDAKGLGISDISEDSLGFFREHSCENKVFRNDLTMSREAYIGMNLTRSYSPCKDKNPKEYEGFVKALNELFDEYSRNDMLYFPQLTKSYVGEV